MDAPEPEPEPPALPEEPVMRVDGLPYPKVGAGKVRELFDLGDACLMVATDRVSAFDVVFREGVPGKGMLLTRISLAWFRAFAPWAEHHLVDGHDARASELAREHPELAGRSMIARKLHPLPIEAVVRGYLSGSAWASYERDGTLFGRPLPRGLERDAPLPEPVFTPTTKAKEGHDKPLDDDAARRLVGDERFEWVRDRSLAIFARASRAVERRGLILADTKFEFGADDAGRLIWMDEALTPDSSRFWPAEEYRPGRPQPSFDKQFIRDYLASLEWDRTPPPPELPRDVIDGARDRYRDACRKLVAAARGAAEA